VRSRWPPSSSRLGGPLYEQSRRHLLVLPRIARHTDLYVGVADAEKACRRSARSELHWSAWAGCRKGLPSSPAPAESVGRCGLAAAFARRRRVGCRVRHERRIRASHPSTSLSAKRSEQSLQPCDLTSPAGCQTLVELRDLILRRVDVLFNKTRRWRTSTGSKTSPMKRVDRDRRGRSRSGLLPQPARRGPHLKRARCRRQHGLPQRDAELQTAAVHSPTQRRKAGIIA